MVSPQAGREAVGILMAERRMGVTRACGLVGISRSLLAYRPRRTHPEGLRERIGEIALANRRYGYRRVHVLLRREGWHINHKRSHRRYREAGLQVRKRARKRIVQGERTPLQQARGPNESWSMDFVADALANGRRIRCLTLVDDFTKECPARLSHLSPAPEGACAGRAGAAPQANWIALHIPPDRRVAIAEVVVVLPRLGIVILARQYSELDSLPPCTPLRIITDAEVRPPASRRSRGEDAPDALSKA